MQRIPQNVVMFLKGSEKNISRVFRECAGFPLSKISHDSNFSVNVSFLRAPFLLSAPSPGFTNVVSRPDGTGKKDRILRT